MSLFKRKPVEHVELSESNVRLRMILIIVALALAVVMIGVGVVNLLNVSPGWKVIDATTDELNCGLDFVFNYYLGDQGAGATAEYRKVSSVYSQATRDAYLIFNEHELHEGVGNLAYISANPNQLLSIDPALYRCLEQIKAVDSRHIYLAGVVVEYDRVFHAQTETEAANYDPLQNDQVRSLVSKLSSFANDPRSIDLELKENNQVKLVVSQEYQAFADEIELERLLDLGWMKNAFIVDFIADRLLAAGHTSGFLASNDGFTRNLDNRGQMYSVNVFDRLENKIYCPAVIKYDQPMSLVYLRNYPTSDLDRWNYYDFPNGRIVTSHVDPSDGLCKSSTDNILAYSPIAGCAEIALRLSSIYIADSFSRDQLLDLSQYDIFSIWGEDKNLQYNDKALRLEVQDDGRTVGYQFSYVTS